MDAVSPTSQLTQLARLVPEVGDRWLTTLGPSAFIFGWCQVFRACHTLKGALCTEAALWMHPISQAAQPPILALWVPEVGHCRYIWEFADMGSRTMNVVKSTTTTETALHILPVRVATVFTIIASGIPVILGLRFGIEGTRRCWCVRLPCLFWAWDPGEREIATESTLDMDTISPTT